MRIKDSKPISFIAKIFRRKSPNKFKKKSAIGKTPSQNSKQTTVRSFLSRTSSTNSASSSSNAGGGGGGGGTFLEFMHLRKKILVFRDIFDIPRLNGSVAIHELVIATINDLNRMYPDLIHGKPILKIKDRNTHQGLICLYDVLDCIADSWVEDKSMRDKFKKPHIETTPLDELVELVLEMLDCINNAAKERFELMFVERKPEGPGSIKVKPMPKPMTDCNSEYSRSTSSVSNRTPTSVLPDSPRFADLLGAMLGSYSSQQLLNLRAHAVEKLSPMDLKRLVVHVMPHFAANDNCNQNPNLTSVEEDKVEAKDQAEIELKEELVDYDTLEKKESGGKTEKENKDEVVEAVEAPSPQPSMPSPNSTKIPPPPPPPPPPPRVPDTSSTQPSPLHSSVHPPPPPPSPCNSPPRTHSTPPNSASAPAPPPPPPSPCSSPPRTHSPPPIPASAPPPPPPPGSSKAPPPPPPGTMVMGGGAPPPPGTIRTIVRPRNRSKLKRSTHMGNLYRLLRGKVEGNCFPGGKPAPGNKHVNNGRNAAGGTSMADALAEMTKRSSYFQQIEGDMEKHGNAIKEVQRHLSAFKTSDMDELNKFHNHVESLLELLTDESQILSRFENFPLKKLETLRMAAALSTKLNGIVSEIQNWKIEPPLAENLNKVEKFFNKIKSELEGLERTKDEESRKFQSQNIHFDFSIFTKIKESMVDLSSGFIELALKERREAKEQINEKTDGTQILSVKMLWRAFQFAFKVYSFAGGQDERADSLTRELATEIELDQKQD